MHVANDNGLGGGGGGITFDGSSSIGDILKMTGAATVGKATIVDVYLTASSGATAATASNSAGITYNIPVSGVDVATHTWEWQIDSNTLIKATATGNGAGGVTGLGVILPQYLAAGSDATFGVNGSYNKIWDFEQTVTDFSSSTSWNGFRGIFTINSSVNLTGGAATYIAGWNFESKIASGNNKDYDFNSSGYLGAFHNGSGTVANQAAASAVSSGLSSGSITNNIGGESVANHQGTGSITTNYGHYFLTGHSGSGGSITTDYTIYVATPQHSRTLTSHYGIYLEDQNFGTTAYAIYTNNGAVRLGDNVSIAQPVYTSGSPTIFTITGGAHTTLAAGTEVVDINFNLSRTIQLSAGALATQRSVVVSPVTYAFTGASTVSFSSTFAVTGLPQAGANATFTNSSALIVGDLNGYSSPAGGTVGLAVVMPGITNGTGATSTLSGLAFLAVGSVNLSNQTATTTNVSMVNLQGITFVSTTNVRTVTNLSTLYIQSAPTASTNVTVSAGGGPFSLFVDAGAIRFDDQVQWGAGVAVTAGNYSVGRDADATNQLHFNVPTGASFEHSINDVALLTMNAQSMSFTQVAATSGSPTMLTLTGASHTTLTASTEVTDVNINLARTIGINTGALTTNRSVRVQAPTIAFVGASTLTNAVTFDISGPPTSGNANTTILNPASLRVGSGNATYISNASFAYSNVNLLANTITLTGSTQVTSAAGLANLRIGIITVTDASAVTVDAAASVYIAGAPAQSGSVTITNKYQLWADGTDPIRFDGPIDLSAIAAGNSNLTITATSDTPTVTWGAVSETIKASAAPAGYLEITVGGAARYIPFWA